jgi:hypothetical protein
VLNLDSWGSPFQAWCEMTRVAEPPFEGNKYTDAGNAVEPKIIAWAKENVSPYVYTPEEFYGVDDAKQAKRYDFFDHAILGGMWDSIVLDGALGKGKPLGNVECKTSSRPQDWVNGPPPKYAVQSLLYSYLNGLPRAFVVVRFMEDHEYAAPHKCECTDDNTFCYDLDVATADIGNGMTIAEAVETALAWHQAHVVNNMSPVYDEKKDKEYLALLRKSEVKDEGIEAIAKQAALIEAKIESIRAANDLDALEKALKDIKDKQLKPALTTMFKPTDEVVTAFGWKLKKSSRTSINKEALAADNLLDKYTVSTDSYTLSKNKE